jgi:5-formyltetrahydrofolate cyclo-ligase
MSTRDEPRMNELTFLMKRELRKRMRALRNTFPSQSRSAKSATIVANLASVPELSNTKKVALFWPMQNRNEVDLRELDAEQRKLGKTLYYPATIQDSISPHAAHESGEPMPSALHTGWSIDFRLLDDPGELVYQPNGISEPPAEGASPDHLDVIVAPCLAVDVLGFRLGYGGGHYDRLFKRYPNAKRVVVAFDFQLVAELPTESHDVPCELIVTDKRVIRTTAQR